MARSAASLAALIHGEVLGDASRELDDVADLANAGPRDLSFLANPKYAGLALETKAGAILVSAPLEGAPCTQLVCPNPYLALATIAQHLHPAPTYTAGIEPGAHVAPTATVDPTAVIRVGAVIDGEAVVGPRTVIGPNAVVGRSARIGADCLLHAGAKVLERCTVGDRVILHAGVVLGSDGFGYAPDAAGKRHKIPQVGIVVVEDDVEIGANTTVDRATFGKTRIGAGTKIDNLVQLAHNVQTGRDCVIVSQSGIAGSTTLGDRVVMGAQCGSVGHIRIGDDVVLSARAGVTHNLPEPGIYGGVPATDHREWLKATASLPSLPELRKRVRALERELARLTTPQVP